MHFCKATNTSKLGHNTVCANVNDRPTNVADLTPKAYLVYTKAKQSKKKVYVYRNKEVLGMFISARQQLPQNLVTT